MRILLKVEDLKKYFPVRKGLFARERKVVHAVDGVSFNIERGETMGLAGESGCGKTTTARLILRLLEPTAGKVIFRDKNILELSQNEMRELRREMQIIFQDPTASLNPRKTVRQILSKPFVTFHYPKEEIEAKVSELLELVGLTPPSLYLDRYPHEFSGGQRQRIVITRAIALHPKFIVCDEPVSSLDVSIRGQILNLMKQLQGQFALTYLMVTHDLAMLRSMCTKATIMYLGKIVEFAKVEDLYDDPLHPYTEALLSATPDPKLRSDRKRIILKGDVPSAIDTPKGCRFHTRCWRGQLKCAEVEPELIEVSKDHSVACHNYWN